MEIIINELDYEAPNGYFLTQANLINEEEEKSREFWTKLTKNYPFSLLKLVEASKKEEWENIYRIGGWENGRIE